jgi:RsiW-degrading membrane proteinase PrsW (M82 family)
MAERKIERVNFFCFLGALHFIWKTIEEMPSIVELVLVLVCPIIMWFALGAKVLDLGLNRAHRVWCLRRSNSHGLCL